jgi:uncharacterized membrane protein YhaH (DUF805 family)
MTPPVSSSGPLGLAWLMLSPIGRVSREPFCLGLALMWSLFAIPMSIWLQDVPLNQDTELEAALAQLVNEHPLLPLMLFLSQWVQIALVMKRLQDKALTGFLAVLLFVPMLNLLLLLALCVIPGDEGANLYGPHPNSRWSRPA